MPVPGSAAILCGGISAFATGNNFGAGTQTGEPAHAGQGGASAWWTWTAPSTGWVTATTRGSGFDTVLAVYTGASVNALTLVAANDNSLPAGALVFAANSTVQFLATQGITYSIAVDGFSAASTQPPGVGDIELTVALMPSITSIMHPNGGAVTLKWPAQPLESYRIESSTNLVDWTVVQTCQPSVSSLMTFTHTPGVPQPPQLFYRIARE